MVGINMDGPGRDRVLKLIQEKERIEGEIRDQTAILESNNVGMRDILVDRDGYPRSDIDVYQVRHARHQIICLQNDHKNLMRRIETRLAEIHAELRGVSASGPSVNPSTSTNGHANGHENGHGRRDSVEELVDSIPFGVVRFVYEGSPAELAGLQTNDKIIEFGSLNSDNIRNIYQIHDIAARSVGQHVNVKVKRENAIVNITIVPRYWAQTGLLGCQIDLVR